MSRGVKWINNITLISYLYIYSLLSRRNVAQIHCSYASESETIGQYITYTFDCIWCFKQNIIWNKMAGCAIGVLMLSSLQIGTFVLRLGAGYIGSHMKYAPNLKKESYILIVISQKSVHIPHTCTFISTLEIQMIRFHLTWLPNSILCLRVIN